MTFYRPSQLGDVDGATLVERARNFITRDYEKNLGQRFTGVELLAFASARRGTWKLYIPPVSSLAGAQIVGLTNERVAALFGKPSSQQEGLNGSATWFYDSASHGTAKIEFAGGKAVAVSPAGATLELQQQRTAGPPPEILVDLTPDAVAEVIISGVADWEASARSIIETLRTTSDPACYFPPLESMLKAISPEK